MVNLGRFQYTAPWRLTNFGWLPGYMLRTQLGSDEWHNRSKYMVIPFIGMIVVFERGMDRSGEEHLYGISNGITEGRIVPRCSLCQELLDSFIGADDVPVDEAQG